MSLLLNMQIFKIFVGFFCVFFDNVLIADKNLYGKVQHFKGF
jgi:hypothetical protein